jgi:hypothetical protein
MRSAFKWLAMSVIAIAAVMFIGPNHAHAFTFDLGTALLAGTTVGGSVKTMADWVKSLDPNGSPARIVEILGQKNALLDDMMFREGNLEIGHRTTIRTGLPTAYWRMLNQGTPVSKATTAQVTESCGILESASRVDVEVANLGGNPAAMRLSEGAAHIEAISQEMAATLFYGNSSLNPEEMNGLAVRYSSLSAANAQNIVNGGGSSGNDQTSIWLICWGERQAFGIFPKGSTAGVKHRDFGEQLVEDGTGITGNVLPAYVDLWQWKAGLVVEDWRYVVRIPNIDVTNLVAESSDADLTKLMTKAVHRLPEGALSSRCAFYCNRTVAEYLDIQRQERVQTGGQLGYTEVDGKNVMSFRGIPIRTCDAILETESVVS